MANQLSILSSFTHITKEIEGISAIVSVQYPELSSLQSISDSFAKVCGNKRAVYLGITSNNIWHIQTVGEKIVKKVSFNMNEIDNIDVVSTTLTGHGEVKLSQINFTTKKITFETIKEKIEKKTVKKTIEVPVFQEYTFTLFPVTFLANLKYNQSQTEVMQTAEMKQSLINFTKKLQLEIAERKMISKV
jgi:hypothetical protein